MIALLLAAAAFLLLGLATDAHHRRRFGVVPPAARARAFRRAAWVLVALSAVAAVGSQGWIFGPVLWIGAAMGGAGIAFLLLNFAPTPSR